MRALLSILLGFSLIGLSQASQAQWYNTAPNIPPPPTDNLGDSIICQAYSNLAKTDFDDGYLNWSSFGLDFGYLTFDSLSSDFTVFFENYLISRYNLRKSDLGCMVFEYEHCYSDTLNSLVAKKLGNSFFDPALTDAKTLFKNWLDSSVSTFEIFDWSKTYYWVDSPAKLIGNDKELQPYMERLNAQSIELEIDTNGLVTTARVLDKVTLERTTHAKLVKELNQKYRWVPAYLYGHKVNSNHLIFER